MGSPHAGREGEPRLWSQPCRWFAACGCCEPPALLVAMVLEPVMSEGSDFPSLLFCLRSAISRLELRMPELQGPWEGEDGAAGPRWAAEGQVMTPPPLAPKSPRMMAVIMAGLVAPFTLPSSSQRAVTAPASSLDPGSTLSRVRKLRLGWGKVQGRVGSGFGHVRRPLILPSQLLGLLWPRVQCHFAGVSPSQNPLMTGRPCHLSLHKLVLHLGEALSRNACAV